LKGGGGYGFLFRSEFFFRTTRELEYLFILSRKARNFFPEFNIKLYGKNSESDYFFFPPPKSEYFFQQHWESEYFLGRKPYPPPVKWSFPEGASQEKIKETSPFH
jgi:hypothetical protein